MLVWSDSKCEPVPTLAQLFRSLDTPIAPPSAVATVQPLAMTEQEVESLRRQEMLRAAKENKLLNQMYRELCAFAGVEVEDKP